MPVQGYLGLVALPIVGTAFAAWLANCAWFHGPSGSLPALLRVCSVPSRQRLPTDLTEGALPQVDDFLCVLVPFFKELVSDRMGVGIFSILISAIVPLLLRLNYLAISPNRSTALLGFGLPLLVAVGGQLVGIGVFAASVGSAIYALGAWRMAKNPTPTSLTPVPARAGHVYLANLATVLSITLFGLQMILNVAGPYWLPAQLAFQFYPTVLLLVAIAAVQVKSPKDERQVREMLRGYEPEEVSYAFERTWGYYRKAGGVSTVFLWYGLSRIYKAWANDGIRNLNDSSHFVLCGAAAAHLTLYLLVLSERLTWRSSSARDPLTGAARPALDLECERAIARAPAGQPYLERGWKGTALSTLLGGPGFAAAMWWARGEEEAGWKARKAWRETVAVEGKKQ